NESLDTLTQVLLAAAARGGHRPYAHASAGRVTSLPVAGADPARRIEASDEERAVSAQRMCGRSASWDNSAEGRPTITGVHNRYGSGPHCPATTRRRWVRPCAAF